MTAALSNANTPDAAGYETGVIDTWSRPVRDDIAAAHEHFLEAANASSERDLLRHLAPVAATTEARFVVLCSVTSCDNDSAVSIRLVCGTTNPIDDVQQQAIANAAREIATGSTMQMRRRSSTPAECLVALAVPGQVGQCLIAWFDRTEVIPQTSFLTLQAVAAQISTWRATQDAAAKDAAALRMAALIELIGRIETAQTPAEACRLLVDELQDYLGCQQVVVGLCRDDGSRCHVAAISNVDAFSANGDKARTAQAGLQETIVRDKLSTWPAPDDGSRYGLKALEQYALACQAELVIGSPLRDDQGTVRGAWLIAGPAEALRHDGVQTLLRAASTSIASALQLLDRAQSGWIAGLLKSLVQSIRQRRGQAVLVVLAMAVAAMFVSVPHRVKCDCQLEPVTRRFVAAPFAGPLKETCVKPGDLVTRGQLLAYMDGREIRWELAGVQADLYRAAKEHTGHVASHEAGEAEVARYEVDRLRSREQLLKARDQDLEIRSPVDGIVVSGDLKDVEGMPLKVGETLFEVAPLNSMIVEVAIPEDDMACVRSGMPVRIILDAFPLHPFQAEIDRVHPRAELRDKENVFVAEVRLDNSRRTLRPGMQGSARVNAGRAPLGWILFHRPIAAALQWLGW